MVELLCERGADPQISSKLTTPLSPALSYAVDFSTSKPKSLEIAKVLMGKGTTTSKLEISDCLCRAVENPTATNRLAMFYSF